MLPADFDGSWARIAGDLLALTTAAQLAAATQATVYVPDVLAEQGIDNTATARVQPKALAGVASDSRPLASLLQGAVRISKAYVGGGMEPAQALTSGGKWLDTTLRTVVADAGRDGAALGQFVTPAATHWVRMVIPPCCSRCALLAGVVYRRGRPLPRHPGCDCTFIPSDENTAGDYRTDPQQLADKGLINDLTVGQRQRLDDGANLSRVLNESRDRWRQRMTVASNQGVLGRRTTWGSGGQEPPTTTVQDLMAHLKADVARRELTDRGFIVQK